MQLFMSIQSTELYADFEAFFLVTLLLQVINNIVGLYKYR